AAFRGRECRDGHHPRKEDPCGRYRRTLRGVRSTGIGRDGRGRRRGNEISVRGKGGLAIYRDLSEIPDAVRPSVVTIGVFDGVHRGHQALLRKVVTEAESRKATPVVVTFDRHPLAVIQPGAEPPLITT